MKLTARVYQGLLVGTGASLPIPANYYRSYKVVGTFHNYELSDAGIRAYFSKQLSLVRYKPTRIEIEHTSANLDHAHLHLGNLLTGLVGSSMAKIQRFKGHDVTESYYVNDDNTLMKKMYLIKTERGYTPDELYLKKNEYGCKPLISAADTPAYYAWRDEYRRYQLDKIVEKVRRWGLHFDRWIYESELVKQPLSAPFADGHAIYYTVGNDKVYLTDSEGNTLYSYGDLVLAQKRYRSETFDKTYCVVGADQKLYTQRIIAITAERLKKTKAEIQQKLSFILVKNLKRSGIKMSKRHENTLVIDSLDSTNRGLMTYLLVSQLHGTPADMYAYWQLIAIVKTLDSPLLKSGFGEARLSQLLPLLTVIEGVSTLASMLTSLPMVIKTLKQTIGELQDVSVNQRAMLKPRLSEYLNLIKALFY